MNKIIKILVLLMLSINVIVTPVVADIDLSGIVTAVNNEETKTIDVTASEDYIKNLFDGGGTLYIGEWSCGTHESMISNKTATGFSLTTINAVGDPGEREFKIVLNNNAYGVYSKTFAFQGNNGNQGSGSGTVEGDKDPGVSSVIFNEETGKIEIACSTSAYFDSAQYLVVDEWWGAGVYSDDIDTTSKTNTIIVPFATTIGEQNGEHTIFLQAVGYKNYSTTFTVSCYSNGEGGDNPTNDSFPTDFSVEINGDGDLLIYSEDEEFLSSLIDYRKGDEASDSIQGIAGGPVNQGDWELPFEYFFGTHNWIDDNGNKHTPLIKDGNLVIFPVSSQLYKRNADVYRGEILNDVDYKVTIIAGEKYGSRTISTPITFTKANKRVPKNDVEMHIAGDYLIISAKNKKGLDFVDNTWWASIAVLDKYNMIVDSRNGDSEITNSLYDTISAKSDRVYELHGPTVNDLTGWVGIAETAGYATFCYDGRPFGGDVTLSVDKFNVNIIGNDGTAYNSENAIGLYQLPAFTEESEAEGKIIKGWIVENGHDDVDKEIRCVGETIFVTSDTNLYVVYEDIPTPQAVNMDAIKNSVIANTVIKWRTENYLDGHLENDSFIPDNEKSQGTVIWVEINKAEDDEYSQIRRAGEKFEITTELVDVFDINVFKQIGLVNETIKITETENAVEISLDLSANEMAQKLAEDGRLGLFSIHEGEVQKEVIRGVYNAETKRYTVKLSKFSTFAFIEAPQDLSTVIKTNLDSHLKPSVTTQFIIPKTGIE